MLSRRMIFAATFLGLLSPNSVVAQDAATALVGVWKVTSVETREVLSGKIVRPFGDQPTGTFVFTRGGRMVGMQYASGRKAPAGPNATESERAALLSTMSAYSGTYRVEGKKVIIAVEDSSIQSWNGTNRTLDIDINGSRLTGTSEPFKSLISGLDVVGVITWKKLE
jgi:Lipocalin-like domain